MFRHYRVILSCRRADMINPLNAELNPICHLLALLGAHHILHVSRIRVNAQYRVSFIILYYDQQMHNYYTNYHNPTCFDTIVSSSGSL